MKKMTKKRLTMERECVRTLARAISPAELRHVNGGETPPMPTPMRENTSVTSAQL
jgi:hypothetical protein